MHLALVSYVTIIQQNQAFCKVFLYGFRTVCLGTRQATLMQLATLLFKIISTATRIPWRRIIKRFMYMKVLSSRFMVCQEFCRSLQKTLLEDMSCQKESQSPTPWMPSPQKTITGPICASCSHRVCVLRLTTKMRI